MSAERDDLATVADVLRQVPIGPFGPNALEILNRGGTTHLNGSERDHLAAALLPLIREREAAAWERALREAADDIVADCSNQPGPCICVARGWLRDRAAANPYAEEDGR